METEFKLYTSEQEEKIEKLRAESREERELKGKMFDSRDFLQSRELKEGDAVYLTLEGKTISGYIMKTKIVKFTRTETKSIVYNIKTPYGVIKDIERKCIRTRNVEDLSNVVLPPEIKQYSTVNLLKMLQMYRCGWDEYFNGKQIFTIEQIKAELRFRPHMPSKRERRIFQNKK